MKQLLRLVANAIALAITVYVVPGLSWGDSEVVTIVVTALIFGVINIFIKPVLKLLSLPIRMMTFGLFSFVINIGLLLLLAWIGGQIGRGILIAGWPTEAFSVEALVAAAIGALLLSIISTLFSFVIRD
ncbi:MAG: phage holin family protein [Candidatus Limnocylindrales bacterium]